MICGHWTTLWLSPGLHVYSAVFAERCARLGVVIKGSSSGRTWFDLTGKWPRRAGEPIIDQEAYRL